MELEMTSLYRNTKTGQLEDLLDGRTLPDATGYSDDFSQEQFLNQMETNEANMEASTKLTDSLDDFFATGGTLSEALIILLRSYRG